MKCFIWNAPRWIETEFYTVKPDPCFLIAAGIKMQGFPDEKSLGVITLGLSSMGGDGWILSFAFQYRSHFLDLQSGFLTDGWIFQPQGLHGVHEGLCHAYSHVRLVIRWDGIPGSPGA